MDLNITEIYYDLNRISNFDSNINNNSLIEKIKKTVKKFKLIRNKKNNIYKYNNITKITTVFISPSDIYLFFSNNLKFISISNSTLLLS